jgi:ribosome-binding ATPase YchF (GTP1/OBG family)
MAVRIGLIGKTNTGKTTFFNAATLQSAEVSNYPFTTKTPNSGVARAVTLCVHREFKVQDNPNNSECVEGWRLIPVEIIDLPGLIKGAWMGKGLGNQFLSVAAQSDALLHIADASGSIDAEGRIAEPGVGDPVADISDIEEELAMWYLKVLEGNREKIARLMESGEAFEQAMVRIYEGIGVKESHIKAAILRDISKPTLIISNKMDLHTSAENFRRIQEEFQDLIVVPSSSEAELTLRKAGQKGLIKYVPGEERFEIPDPSKLNKKQEWALNYIRKAVLGEYMRTGVQFAINVAVFKLLGMNTVYPVYDPSKLTDKHGNVLPDVLLLPSGANVLDLAREVHSDLAKGLLYAIDTRTGLRLPPEYSIKDRDVLSIVSTTKKKS